MGVRDYVETSSDPWGLEAAGLDERRSLMIKKCLSSKGLVLDLGCAFGIYTDFLSALGNSAVGIDFSSRMVGRAKKLFPGRLFVCADAGKLPFKGSVFDAVLLMGTCIYVKNRKLLFSEVFRVMKKGGTLCVIERNKYSVWHRLARKENAVDDMSNFVSIGEISALLNDNGFCVKRVAGDTVALPLFSRNKITKKLFWCLGEIIPSAAYFIVTVAEKK